MRVEHAMPSRIVGKIPARDTAKAGKPDLESAVPGIHVPDMDGATRAEACPDVHGLVRDACFRAKATVRRGRNAGNGM